MYVCTYVCTYACKYVGSIPCVCMYVWQKIWSIFSKYLKVIYLAPRLYTEISNFSCDVTLNDTYMYVYLNKKNFCTIICWDSVSGLCVGFFKSKFCRILISSFCFDVLHVAVQTHGSWCNASDQEMHFRNKPIPILR
jgi:hypothetical protein